MWTLSLRIIYILKRGDCSASQSFNHSKCDGVGKELSLLSEITGHMVSQQEIKLSKVNHSFSHDWIQHQPGPAGILIIRAGRDSVLICLEPSRSPPSQWPDLDHRDSGSLRWACAKETVLSSHHGLVPFTTLFKHKEFFLLTLVYPEGLFLINGLLNDRYNSMQCLLKDEWLLPVTADTVRATAASCWSCFPCSFISNINLFLSAVINYRGRIPCTKAMFELLERRAG